MTAALCHLRRAQGRRVVVVAAALLTTSCAASLMKLPGGPSSPAPDAGTALAQATSICGAVRSFAAEIGVSGSVARHRVRGRLLAGFEAPSSTRMEAVAPFGQPLFILVASGDDATLLLPRDGRILEHGRTTDVIEAIAGVPIGSAELRLALTGCPPGEVVLSGAIQRGDLWREIPAGANGWMYLHRDRSSDPWRLVAAFRNLERIGRQWLVEYRDFQNGLARSIHMVSVGVGADSPGGSSDGSQYDLHLALSQVDINTALPADTFRVRVPASAEPITLDELRQSGPLSVNDR